MSHNESDSAAILQPAMQVLEHRITASSVATPAAVNTSEHTNNTQNIEESPPPLPPPFKAFVIMNGSSKTICTTGKNQIGHIHSNTERDASGNVIVVAQCTNKLIAHESRHDRDGDVAIENGAEHGPTQDKDIPENAKTINPQTTTQTHVEDSAQPKKMNGCFHDSAIVDAVAVNDDKKKRFDDDDNGNGNGDGGGHDNVNSNGDGGDTPMTTNGGGGVRMIGNNVIRSQQIERLIEKIGTFSSNTNTATNTPAATTAVAVAVAATATASVNAKSEQRVSRNPVTNKFSTYYNRTQAIGGTLVQTQQIGESDTNEHSECATADHDNVTMLAPLADNTKNSNNKDNENNNNHVEGDIVGNDDDDDDDDDDEDDDEGEEEEDVYNSVNVGVRRRARTRLEQQHFKKAKKYCAPPDELTRLQIRNDIRKMRNPQMNDISSVLKLVGFERYIGHKSYVSLMQPPRSNNNNNKSAHSYENNGHSHNYGDGGGGDDEVQFIGTSTTTTESHTNNNASKRAVIDIADNRQSTATAAATSASKYDCGPPSKKAKLQSTNKELGTVASFTCNKCGKAFAMEVDLILHKNHDQC
mmetsp:Transcript_52603/g.87115  ORF Transcript_52603/g.87115 Transcript_52603/m.87115 type:complete len:584 (+) Transcript_52603:112-1863(+)